MTAESEKLPSANLPLVERKINGTRYVVTRLGWWGMMDALHRAEALLGPALEAMLGADIQSIASALEADGGSVAKAVSLLVRRLTDRDGRELLEILGRQTMVEAEGRKVWLSPDVMDTWFSQRPADALLWLAFAVEVQLRDFFEQPMRELGAALGAKATTTASPSRDT